MLEHLMKCIFYGQGNWKTAKKNKGSASVKYGCYSLIHFISILIVCYPNVIGYREHVVRIIKIILIDLWYAINGEYDEQSTLADEFLADLDELEAEENEEVVESNNQKSAKMELVGGDNKEEEDSEYGDSDNDEEVDILVVTDFQLNKTVMEYIPGAVTNLLKDQQYITHMEVYCFFYR